MSRLKTVTTMISMASVIAPIFSSCSPNVVTNITKEYPAKVDPSNVYVYNIGDSIPNDALYLGNVIVTAGNSNAANCQYSKVLNKAIASTAQNGGNLLALTSHRDNVGFNLCHEVSGNILRVNDTAQLIGQPYLQSVNQADEIPKSYTMPKSTLLLGFGFGNVSSSLYLPNGNKAPKSSHRGYDFYIGYDYMFNKHIGMGIQYSGFMATLDYGQFNSNYIINFLGPHVVFKQQPNSGRFIFEERIGYGWFNFYEWAGDIHSTTDGFGSTFQLGVEYLLSDRCGIAFSVGSVFGNLPNEYDAQLPNDEKSGISRMFVDIGCRFHF